MKSTVSLILALLAATTVSAQLMMPVRPEAHTTEPMRVDNEVVPVFPREMTLIGVRDGYALIAFGVTAEGKVDDSVPVAYSDRAFADVALGAIKGWTFHPLYIDGKPVASTSQVTFSFKTDGTVLVMLSGGSDDVEIARTKLPLLGREKFQTQNLRDLDAIPRPISAAAPNYPASYLKQGVSGTVRVDFFIDQNGAVRLPSVDPSADQELAALAIAALQTWRFEPPTIGHRPVQVRASQLFRFGPSK
ncbi:MAG TPA: TonB family protein [Opitutaceae bacterium]|jgi:TonB family protein